MAPKTVIVTGGAGGLGLTIASQFAEKGYQTAVFDIDEKRLASLNSSSILPIRVDVTSEDSVCAGVQTVEEQFGEINVLVNNAGTIFSKPLINLTNPQERRHSYESFCRNVEINLNACFLVGSVVAERMVMGRISGTIINISSISACGNAGQSAYSAAKAGVESLTKVWCKELGPYGIRVNAVAPGFINMESTQIAMSPHKLDELSRETPLRRLGQAKNIAQAVWSLVENDFVSGAVLPVDGGLVF